MITQDSFEFTDTDTHGDLVPREPRQLRLVEGDFFGVVGVSHLTGHTGGQSFECELHLSGYDSAELLDDKIFEIDEQAGELTGDVLLTGTLEKTVYNCTFLGIVVKDPGVRKDAATGKWFCDATLLWRQRKRG